jgi:hypothetical protein
MSDQPAPPRDLSDFVLRWRTFRAVAEAAKRGAGVDEQGRIVIGWLIALADRVGPADVAQPKAAALQSREPGPAG